VSALASPRRRRRAPGLPGADGGGLDAARHAWWGELRHGGLLLAPALLDELLPEERALDERAYDRLRTAWLAFDAALYGAGAIDAARRDFARAVWEDFLGLRGWERGSGIRPEQKATAATGERLRPDWVLSDGDAAPLVLLVFDDADRLGVGRGRRAHARLVELLRATGAALGVLTNGRQLRLVHAGPDFDAWAEWDAQTWFDEGPGRETLRGLATLLGEQGEGDYAAVRRLIAAIRDSRTRQGDLAQVLGEQVRRAVEGLVTEADRALAADPALRDALWTDPRTGHALRDDDAHHALYQAATRVVMRLVLLLYAEARDLLPASVEAYHDSYGVEALHRTLHEAAQEGADGAADHQGAWLRLLALFRLVYGGSPHPDLPVRAYGGQLFRPGDRGSHDATLRALAVLEESRPTDAAVARLLRLLKVGKVKVRAGRGARWVAGAVDFGSLRTEYIGIVYEGLLDYELRRAPPDDPIVVLDVGRQPSLPLSRLRGLGPAELKELLKAFKKEASKARGRRTRGRRRGRPRRSPRRPRRRRRRRTAARTSRPRRLRSPTRSRPRPARRPASSTPAPRRWPGRARRRSSPGSSARDGGAVAIRPSASARSTRRHAGCWARSSPPGGSTSSPRVGCGRARARSTPARRSRSRSSTARSSRSATSATATGSCPAPRRGSSRSRSASRRWARARSSWARCATSSRRSPARLSTTGRSAPSRSAR